MRGQERVHHVNFLQPHQRGVQHFSLPEYSENSGKCISITLSTHVETVVLLGREKVDGYVDINLDVEKIEGKAGRATYKEISEYVQEKYGLHVPNLYIGQIKSKVGIDKRKNYNIGSGEGRVPTCPPEKEEAIMDAFRHFRLI